VIVSELPPAESFEVHYRSLILGAARRSASFESQLQRAMGHRLRARRAELRERELTLISGEATRAQASVGTQRGGSLRAPVAVTWFATVALLVAGVTVFGIRSWQTGLADLALIALTFTWFLVDSRGARERSHLPQALAAAGPASGGRSAPVVPGD
jgi:Flp pilus assembly protein TadB